MTRWAPERSDTIHSIVAEVLQNYGHGRVVVAVDGQDAAITASFADDLAVDLRGQGHEVERGSISAGSTADSLRSSTIGPFRMAGQTDAVLVVDGSTLLGPELRGFWNFSVRLDGAEPSTDRADASAIVSVADPEHPRRVFADSC
jgi:uridine kinase